MGYKIEDIWINGQISVGALLFYITVYIDRMTMPRVFNYLLYLEYIFYVFLGYILVIQITY